MGRLRTVVTVCENFRRGNVLACADRPQPAKSGLFVHKITEELFGMDRQFTDLRADFIEVLDEVSGLLFIAYEQLGHVPEDHVLAQEGFENGKEIVLDYVDHNEAGIAYEHLMYMIDEPSLAISERCRAVLDRIAKGVKSSSRRMTR
jgi:hypothetical protein